MRKLCIVISLFSVLACQEVEQPTTVLTQDQWKEVQKFILDSDPSPKFKLGTVFDNKIELIGVDVSEPLVPGQKATFTWYWKALEDLDSNWKVFVHLDAAEGSFRQNLDHVPVNDMYQTGRWKKGQIIKDVHEVTIKGDFPNGKAIPYFGFYKGNSRLPISNNAPKDDAAQPRAIGPTIAVKGTKKAERPLPSYIVQKLDDASAKQVKIDGKLDETFWRRARPISLFPFGSAPRLLTRLRAVYTNDALIIAAELDDKHAWGTLKNRDDETWKEEVLEFFIDANGDEKNYLEMQVTPLNTVFDAKFPVRLGKGTGSRTEQIKAAKSFNIPGLATAVTVDGTVNDAAKIDKKWFVEIKIPIASIPDATTPPKQGEKWSANFYRFDRPKSDVTHAYAWSTGPRGDFHQIKKFGTLELGGPLAAAAPKVTPEMLEKVRENVNIKIPSKMKMPKGVKPELLKPKTK